MLKVVSANLNGIRAAARKGFFDWMAFEQPDVVCMQETKAQTHQLDDPVFFPVGYHRYLFDAEKKGYSGVAIYTRKEPDNVSVGLGFLTADTEGRYIQADFGNLSIASLYLPSGTSSDLRQDVKYDFMDQYMSILQAMMDRKQSIIICGDWNIAHKEIDIKNWRTNQTASGFLPKERAWLDQLFDEVGFVDGFRVVNQEADQYTWWSNFGRARENNVGWRIDYQIISPDLKDQVRSTRIYKEKWFSDHAPLIMEYDMPKTA